MTGVIVFVAFMAAGRIFVTPEKLPRGLLLILLLSILGLISFLYFTTGELHGIWPLLLAETLILLSAALFAWTVRSVSSHRLYVAFIDATPPALLTIGAYHSIRHPFYLAYILYWTGAAIAAWHWSTTMIALALVVIYIRAAWHEERLLLASGFAGAYRHYRRRTGFLWPRPF